MAEENTKKKESLFKEEVAPITFGFFDKKEYDAKPTPKSFPVHMDPTMATFGEKGNGFSGDIQGGLSGLIVNIDGGNTYRITTQQILDFVVELEKQKGNPDVQDEE